MIRYKNILLREDYLQKVIKESISRVLREDNEEKDGGNDNVATVAEYTVQPDDSNFSSNVFPFVIKARLANRDKFMPIMKEKGLEKDVRKYEDDDFWKENQGGNYILQHFIGKLTTLANGAEKTGCDISFKVVPEEKEGKAKFYVGRFKLESVSAIFDVVYRVFHVYVTAESDNFQMRTPDGKEYVYLGSIYPILLHNSKDNDESSIVIPAKGMAGNIDIMQDLEKTASHGTCDYCHRNESRGVYHAFMNPETREIIKLGSTCASKYFGVDIAKRVANIGRGLSMLGNEPYLSYNAIGDGDYVGEKITSTVFKDTANEFEPYISATCMYIAMYGLTKSVKNNKAFDALLECMEYIANNAGRDLPKRYLKLLSTASRSGSGDILREFYSNIYNFSKKMEPKNDFEEMLKQYGLLCSGGFISHRGLGKIRYGMLPYVVLNYFNTKDIIDKKNSGKFKVMEPFSGRREFDITVKGVGQRNGYNGIYYMVQAVTDDHEEIMFSCNDANMYEQKGRYKIEGKYERLMSDDITTQLSYVRQLGTISGDEVAATDEKESVSIDYPPDGTMLRNEQVEIVKSTGRFFVVRTSDGCEYFVSNETGGFGWNDPVRVKWPDHDEWAYPGNVVNMKRGKVVEYQKRDGGVGHKLILVQWK